MVEITLRILPDLEDYRTEAPATPANRTELFRIVVLLVDQVCLIEYLLRLLQANTVFSPYGAALGSVELEAHTV
jgi:hypothetical protein